MRLNQALSREKDLKKRLKSQTKSLKKALKKSDKGGAEDYRMNAIVWGNGSAVKKKALEMLATN